MASFSPSRSSVAAGVAAFVVAAAVAVGARYGLVDSTVIGQACEAGEESLRCEVRLAINDGFRSLVPGFAAIVAGLWCLWRPTAAAMLVTLLVAGLCLFLFNAWPAGLAVTLVLLSLGRPARQRRRTA